ncbi:MAG: SUMF1/EgtB/PvdO family nonheme iron enzyme [bacterium]|nr:SUMF1/EgtB/PvdO family nonheme iron enzyme [bacterium]
MKSLIEALKNGKKIGDGTWCIEDDLHGSIAVREITGVRFEDAKRRCTDIQNAFIQSGLDKGKHGDGIYGVLVPIDVVEEKGRVFVRRPWAEGRPLASKKTTDPQAVMALVRLLTLLPKDFIFYDLRPQHIIETSHGLILCDPGWNRRGTPPYSSPEQNGRGEICPASGLYQLGVTLHYLFRRELLPDALTLLLPNCEPPLIENIPSTLALEINGLLEADPEERTPLAAILQGFENWLRFRDKADEDASSEPEPAALDDPFDDEPADKAVPHEYSVADSMREYERVRAGNSMGWMMAGLVLLPLAAALVTGIWAYNRGLEAGNSVVSEPSPSGKPLYPSEDNLPMSWTNLQDGSPMVLVPAGSFASGPDPQAGYGAEPVIKDLPAFYIDRYEITNKQFSRFVDITKYKTDGKWKQYATPDRRDHPVICVSWYDANAYAIWAGKRLPTADEWEKAARGGDGRPYPWGTGWDSTRLNCSESALGNTAPVGSFPRGASPYGAEDMAGNVWEWVDAWFIPLGQGSEALPLLRMARGGSRSDPASDCTVVSAQGIFPENGQLVNSGFRCALDPIRKDKDGKLSKEAKKEKKAEKQKAKKKFEEAQEAREKAAEAERKKAEAEARAQSQDYTGEGYEDEGGYDGGYDGGSEGGYDSGYSDGGYSDYGSNEGRYEEYGGYGDDDGSYGGSYGSSAPAPPANSVLQESTVMNMSSEYVEPDDPGLTGDHE